MVRLTDCLNMTRAVDWDVKNKTKLVHTLIVFMEVFLKNVD